MEFREWLANPNKSTRDRLEGALREYMATKTPAKRCYYITSPRNMHFDPDNPKHVEDELGPDYDRSTEVMPFKSHPTAFTCASVADGLVNFLRDRGFKARKVAGWYGKAEKGYHTGIQPSLDSASPPRGFGTNPQEHWWVEAEGYYVDLTSAQFHPLSPKDQRDMVIRDKHDAFVHGDYMPVRRFPLGRSVPLPPNVSRMVDKIISLKKFAKGHSSSYSDRDGLAEWIRRNASKFALASARVDDIVAALNAHTRPGFHFADRRAMERLFGEAFDDIEEDKSLDNTPSDFKPEKKGSRGVIRFTRAGITLSSTYPDDLEENFEKLKDTVNQVLPDIKFGEAMKSFERGGYGTTIHYIASRAKGADAILLSRELLERLRKERFKVG